MIWLSIMSKLDHWGRMWPVNLLLHSLTGHLFSLTHPLSLPIFDQKFNSFSTARRISSLINCLVKPIQNAKLKTEVYLTMIAKATSTKLLQPISTSVFFCQWKDEYGYFNSQTKWFLTRKGLNYLLLSENSAETWSRLLCKMCRGSRYL